MLLDKLRANQLSGEGWAWNQQHLAVLAAYDGAGGRAITVRATAWTDRNRDGRVQSVRRYQDVSPLYSRAAAVERA